MNFGPGEDEARLLRRQLPADYLDHVDGKYARLFLEVRVEVRAVVRSSGLNKHPNHDPKESADLWQRLSTVERPRRIWHPSVARRTLDSFRYIGIAEDSIQGTREGSIRETWTNWYRLEGMEGWLCPALFKYSQSAPARIYREIKPIAR